MNSRFINFIIGGCYLGDRFQPYHNKIKKIFLDIYYHLLEQWRKVVKWREEDE